MTNPQPYIVRRGPGNGRKVRHFITEMLHVSEIDEHRPTGRNLGGLFREVESTGRKVKGVLRIRTGDRVTVDSYGDKGSHVEHVATTAEGVKALVRRARPEELALIAEVDEVITDLQARLKEARAARAEAVATAWRKAHVVTLKEIQALVAAPQPQPMMDEKTRQQVAAAHAEIRKAFGQG